MSHRLQPCDHDECQMPQPIPCPFCRSPNVRVRFYNQPSVCCESCLCMGPASHRLTKTNKDQCEREAIVLWNKR